MYKTIRVSRPIKSLYLKRLNQSTDVELPRPKPRPITWLYLKKYNYRMFFSTNCAMNCVVFHDPLRSVLPLGSSHTPMNSTIIYTRVYIWKRMFRRNNNDITIKNFVKIFDILVFCWYKRNFEEKWFPINKQYNVITINKTS